MAFPNTTFRLETGAETEVDTDTPTYASATVSNVPAHDPFRYVLSAGRTGTVFLEGFLNSRFASVTAVHEPAQTRALMMLANMRNDWNIGHGALRRLFHAGCSRRIEGAAGDYVELNPFLCPLTDLLPCPTRELRVVHMVRDPASWAQSLTSFKASTKFRALIDYVPFAKPYPSPRPDGWQGLSEYERTLWRWNWCNARIEALIPACAAYELVRYEDLFDEDPDIASTALARICIALDLPSPGKIDMAVMSRRANPKPTSNISADPAAARRVCGDRARQYGYDY